MRDWGVATAAALGTDGLVVSTASGRDLLRGIDLTVESGEVAAVLGRSGCGKSTLLDTISGIVPWLRPARVRGRLLLNGEPVDDLDVGQRAHLLGTCRDRPDAQLFLPTPRDELEAARRLHGGSSVDQAAAGLGLIALLDRRTAELSSGERQRVALACALAAAPRPVLLDEPTAHLDDDGAAALARLIRVAASGGAAVLLTEQAPWRLDGVCQRWLELVEGTLRPVAAPGPPRLPAPPEIGDTILLGAAGVAASRGGRSVLHRVDLELRAGEIVLISGVNGAGKSTLARVLAGYMRLDGGRVERPRGGVALMLPTAELQLFAASVARELSSLGAGSEEVSRVLRRHRLEALAARPPWSLSRGERQRLVHAALDLGRPAVMVVDEPGQGLDACDLTDLVGLFHRRAEKGRAYLLLSHRRELAAAAHRHLVLEGGRLQEAAR